MTAPAPGGRFSLAELGLTPAASAPADPDPGPVRSAAPRRLVGLDEVLEADVPLGLIEATAWRAVLFQCTDGHGRVDVPAHVALALAPREDGPSVDGLRRLVPSTNVRSALRRALLRLAHLHRRGVAPDRIVDVVFAPHPIVFYDSPDLAGPGLPAGEYGVDWVWVRPLTPAASRECDVVALAMVRSPSTWWPGDGYGPDGFLVARADAEVRGWVAPHGGSCRSAGGEREERRA